MREYLEVPLGYELLAKKHGIPSASPIKKWAYVYKTFGKEGLSEELIANVTGLDITEIKELRK